MKILRNRNNYKKKLDIYQNKRAYICVLFVSNSNAAQSIILNNIVSNVCLLKDIN
jgi:hypothetical protein